jgi:hypothetical protein
MTLPHQDDEEEERKNCEEPHHSIHPAYGDLCDPLVDVEVDRETEEQTHRVNGDGGFDSVGPEAFCDVAAFCQLLRNEVVGH